MQILKGQALPIVSSNNEIACLAPVSFKDLAHIPYNLSYFSVNAKSYSTFFTDIIISLCMTYNIQINHFNYNCSLFVITVSTSMNHLMHSGLNFFFIPVYISRSGELGKKL